MRLAGLLLVLGCAVPAQAQPLPELDKKKDEAADKQQNAPQTKPQPPLPPKPRPRKALCARCGAVLYQRHPHGLERTAALTAAALVLFAIANSFPILTLELQGERTDATLAGAVAALWSQNMQLVAALVAFTAIVMPLAELCALAWLLVPLRFGVRAPRFGAV